MNFEKELSNELKLLFRAKDKYFQAETDIQIAVLVRDIIKTHYSHNSVLRGVKSLHHKYTHDLSINTILDAIALTKDTSVEPFTSCKVCDNGFVRMRNVANLLDCIIYRCTCSANSRVSVNIPNWNGLYKLIIKGQKYKVLMNRDCEGFSLKNEWIEN